MSKISILFIVIGCLYISVSVAADVYSLDEFKGDLSEKFSEFSAAQKMVNSGLFDQVYRFAVVDDASGFNAYDMYFAVGVRLIGKQSLCEVFARYISHERILKSFSCTLDQVSSKDLSCAIEYSEMFSLPSRQSVRFQAVGTIMLTAEKVSSDKHTIIIRGVQESLPAKFLVDYMMKLIEQKESYCEE